MMVMYGMSLYSGLIESVPEDSNWLQGCHRKGCDLNNRYGLPPSRMVSSYWSTWWWWWWWWCMFVEGLYLVCDSAGGVELTTRDGKIRVTNTLESRLELISSQVRPLNKMQTL